MRHETWGRFKPASSRYSAAYLLLAMTGLRRGEALGLRWSDLDLDAGRASIRQTVIAIRHTVMLGTQKTAKGRRTITPRRRHRVGASGASQTASR
jgi:integrase